MVHRVFEAMPNELHFDSVRGADENFAQTSACFRAFDRYADRGDDVSTDRSNGDSLAREWVKSFNEMLGTDQLDVTTFGQQKIAFSISKMRDVDSVPAQAFDSIADNLLQNALDKRNREPALEINIRLFWRNGICLDFCDNGTPIKEETSQSLLSEPVPSNTGMGVGLYQGEFIREMVPIKIFSMYSA